MANLVIKQMCQLLNLLKVLLKQVLALLLGDSSPQPELLVADLVLLGELLLPHNFLPFELENFCR